MPRGVACAKCEAILLEPSDLPADQQQPCPNCGSLSRTFSLEAKTGVYLSTTATATATATATVISAAELLLQAVVVPGKMAVEGRIVEAVAPAWFEIVRLLKNDPAFMYKIDHRKWEEILAGAYEQAGFDEVILTPRSGDFGRDVIATKKGYWSIRIIDQMKAYKPGHLVSADEVRSLVGVLLMDHQASKGLVTTTSDFAPKLRDDLSIKPLFPYRLELVNGTDLMQRLVQIAHGFDAR